MSAVQVEPQTARYQSTIEQLNAIALDVLEKGVPRKATVRELISWTHAMRRGYWVVTHVRSELTRLGLETKPDFEVAYIDGEVEFVARREVPPNPAVAVNPQLLPSDLSPENSVSEPIDPVPRIGMLPAANRPLVSVTRDQEVTVATTLMLLNDYSQLPVTQNGRQADGLISWKSIGRQRALGKEVQWVRQCIDPVETLNYDQPLFEAVEKVVRGEAVLVRGYDGKLSGLVTTSDISLQFRSLSEAFLLLGEIENHVRRLISGHFSLDELRAVVAPDDKERKIEDVSDLTLGEYVRLLERPENWTKTGLPLDRASFVKRLEQIRIIRNEVMHFHPDGIADEDKALLRDSVKFLQAC